MKTSKTGSNLGIEKGGPSSPPGTVTGVTWSPTGTREGELPSALTADSATGVTASIARNTPLSIKADIKQALISALRCVLDLYQDFIVLSNQK